MKKIQVAIVMGSDSDLPVMSESAKIMDVFSISHEISIVSAHRTPSRMFEFAKKAKSRGVKVIIAGAGGAAHLPGMIAAITNLPVIGVPIKSSTMSGVDSLYSIVQMPPGVPVATVAINGARNAGILAAQIISISDKKLDKKVEEYKKKLEVQVEKKSEKLEKAGYSKYLNEKIKKS